MTGARALVRGALVALAGLGLAPDATAEPPANAAVDSHAASAKAAFDRGLAHANRAEYEEAIEAFLEAYAIHPHHSVLYNVAQSYQKLGNVEMAATYLKRYLAEGGARIPAKLREPRTRELEELERRLHPVVSVMAECPVEDTALLVDGSVVAQAPFTSAILLAPGDHNFEFRREGYLPDHRKLHLAGSSTRIVCELHRAAARTEPAAAPDPGAVAASTQDAPPDTHGSRVLAYTLAGVGAAAVGVGVGLLIWNEDRQNQWQTEDDALQAFRDCNPSCDPPVPTDFNERQRVNNDLAASLPAGDVAWITTGVVGLALLGTAGALVLFESEDSDASAQLSLGPRAVLVRGTW